MEADLSSLNQQLQQISAEMALIKAQQKDGRSHVSPWIPLKEAASQLHFSSARALRHRIKKGLFPPDCVCIDPTSNTSFPRYLIHVERYIKQLR